MKTVLNSVCAFAVLLGGCAFPGLSDTIGSNFSITPKQPGATTTYQAVAPFACPPNPSCYTILNPLSAIALPPGGTAGWTADMAAMFPGFTPIAGGNLQGAFNVNTYQAVGGASVGANFNLTYKPTGTDPGANGNYANLHWIQRVFDNFNITAPNPANRGFGKPEDVIDNDPNNPALPYYDGLIKNAKGMLVPFSIVPNFEDASRRAAMPGITWSAELFLVKDDGKVNGKEELTVYDGVSWGWRTVVPEPATVLISGIGLLLLGFTKRSKR